MGRSNCSRVLVYSAVRRSACSHTPVAIEHRAAVARSTIQSTMAAPDSGPPSTSLAGNVHAVELEAGCGDAGCRVLALAGDAVALGSTSSTTSAVVAGRAGTRTRSATSPAGTHVLTPSTRQPSPSARAVVGRVGAASVPVSASAAVSTVSPATTPGRYCCFWASEPNSRDRQRAAARRSAAPGPARRCGRSARAAGTGLDEPEAAAADVLGQGDAEQAGLGQSSAHSVAVEPARRRPRAP